MLSGKRTTQRFGRSGRTGGIRVVDDGRNCAEGVVGDRGQSGGPSRIAIGIEVKRQTAVGGIKIIKTALIRAV